MRTGLSAKTKCFRRGKLTTFPGSHAAILFNGIKLAVFWNPTTITYTDLVTVFIQYTALVLNQVNKYYAIYYILCLQRNEPVTVLV